MKVHFIQQDAWVEPGEYLAWAERHGYETSFTRCWLYEPVPETADADCLIILGGWQCPATTKDECGYFDAEAEMALIRSYVGQGRIVVGACLGAQLLGEALGAPFAHSPEREIGPVRARLTGAGRADPLFAAFPDSFYAGEWHNDMPGLTADSVILAESDGCPRQIVRYGELAYGFQAHLEFNRQIIEAGIREAGESLKKGGKYVQTEEELLAFDYSQMNALLSAFLDALTEKYRRRQDAQAKEHGSGRNPGGLALGMGLGVAVGVAIGSATGNIGLWTSIGLSLGIVFGLLFDQGAGEDGGERKK